MSQAQIVANSRDSTRRTMMAYATGDYTSNPSTKRDIWCVGGFPENPSFFDFYTYYKRNGIANAVVKRKVDRCWITYPKIFDGEAKEGNYIKTKFEKEIDVLVENYDLFEKLSNLDECQRVGAYGGLLIIAAEEQNQNGTKKSPIDPLVVRGGVNALKNLKPCFEAQIIPNTVCDDIQSERFGYPETYNYISSGTGTSISKQSVSMNIHHSRCFVFSENAMDGIDGDSCLKAVLNPMMDLEKTRTSSSEGYYRNAKQRMTLTYNDDQTYSNMNDPEKERAFYENLNDFEDGFDSTLLVGGMTASSIQSSISDPSGTANIAYEEIVAGSGIPKTILTGFETGERSSTENSATFNRNMQSRRNKTLSKMIIDFLRHLIDIGILSEPQNGFITCEWDSLDDATDSEKLDLGVKMTTINQSDYNAGGIGVFSREEIRGAAGYVDVAVATDEMVEA